MTTYVTHSAEETERIGEMLGKALLERKKEQAFVALFGEMGVGKTAFIRGFARAFGISSVKSPTYTVVNEYSGVPFSLFHFDMYRITDTEDLYSIGYEDYLRRRGILLCEWSEKILSEIPSDAIAVRMQKTGDSDERIIEIGEPYADRKL